MNRCVLLLHTITRKDIFRVSSINEYFDPQMEYFNSVFGPSGSNSLLESEAIRILSDRLQNSTHATDRRSAVLGLKSFSRHHRELVVESGLKALLSTFALDSDSSQTVKAILETILILYLKTENNDQTRGWISSKSRAVNGKYPSPILLDGIETDQLSLWIADELTLTNAYCILIIDVLASEEDFFSRIYALQLLESLLLVRPTEVKELLTNIPTAISTITTLLDSEHDQIRNETIILLMALVRDDFNAQKLVVFENTLDRIFDIIEEEGGIRGSLIVQDCLSLCKNLLVYNASNQEFFLETNLIGRLSSLVSEPVKETDELEADPPIMWTEQRLMNMNVALDICRLFVFDISSTIRRNQMKLEETGILFSILKMAFHPDMDISLRSTSLQLAGDIISNNASIQDNFCRLDVPDLDPSLPAHLQNLDEVIPVLLALLKWSLLLNSVHYFDIRLSATYCLLASFKGNKSLKSSFMNYQLDGCPDIYAEDKSVSESDAKDEQASEPANIFTSLLSLHSEKSLNPYRIWFSSYILVELIRDFDEAKQILCEAKIGNEDEGEEVMAFAPALADIMVTVLENSDPRIPIGYLTLLSFWLFEDCKAVNEILKDRSMIESLLRYLSRNSIHSSIIVHGMGALLVGICYEFSTKSSPFNRKDLHELIEKLLGLDNYLSKVQKLQDEYLTEIKSSIYVTDFERDDIGLPTLYFIPPYLDLIKENFSRLKHALLHDPDEDPILRIDYDLFEDIRKQKFKLTQELNECREAKEESVNELKKLEKELNTRINDLLQKLEEAESQIIHLRTHGDDLLLTKTNLDQQIAEITKVKDQKESSLKDFQQKLESTQQDLKELRKNYADLEHKLKVVLQAKETAETGINKMNRELMKISKEKNLTEEQLKKSKNEVSKLQKSLENSERAIKSSNSELATHKSRVQKLEDEKKKAENGQKKAMEEIQEVKVALEKERSRGSHCDEKIEKLASSLEWHKKTLNEQINKTDKLQVDIDNVNNEHKSLLEKLEASKQEAIVINEALKKSQSLLEELRSKCSQLTDNIKLEADKFKADLAAKDNTITSLESTNKEYREQIEILETKLADETKEKDLKTATLETDGENFQSNLIFSLKQEIQHLQRKDVLGEMKSRMSDIDGVNISRLLELLETLSRSKKADVAENMSNGEKEAAKLDKDYSGEDNKCQKSTKDGVNVSHDSEKKITALQLELQKKEKMASEFEDLMLAWEEQVQKNERYRRRILDLDPNYTSEDEEEDEEDDEEDDEEEEEEDDGEDGADDDDEREK